MKIYCFFFLLFGFYSVNAQLKGKAKLDSMLNVLTVSKGDTAKVKLIHQIANLYSKRDFDSSIYYCNLGLSLAQGLKFKKGMEALYRVMGNAFKGKGEYAAAMIAYEKALKINREIGNKDGETSALQNMGSVQLDLMDDVKAISYLMEGLAIAEETKNYYMLASINNSLYSVYFNQHDYKKAKQFSLKGLEFSKKANKPDVTAGSLRDLGCSELELGDTVSARDYFVKALHIYETTGNKLGQAAIYSYLSVASSNLGVAIEQGLSAKSLWDSLSPANPIAINNLGNLGGAYLDIVRYDTLHLIKPGGAIPAGRDQLLNIAEKYLYEALTLTKETDKFQYYHFAQTYSELKEIKGDYKAALQYLKISTKTHDSLYSQESKNEIASLINEKEINARDKEISLNKLSMSANRRQRIALISGIALLAVIGGLLFWQSRTRKRTNTTLLKLNTELDEANKVKARFFAILSHDLRSPVANLISFLELQHDQDNILSEQQKSIHQKKISDAAHSLLETMEAMLLWSKGQMESFKPVIKQVPVRELFNHLERFYSTTENIEIRFINDGGATVATDENYLQTIMHNLTSNSIKSLQHTNGGVIEWKATQENGQTILSVTDNGPGIEKEKFKALTGDVTEANEKTGFGFHMIRDLARAIDCKITWLPTPGKGTTFKLTV